MQIQKTVQVAILTVIILFMSLSSLFVSHPVEAASPEQTILYFAPYDLFDPENTDDLGNILMDRSKPTITNESEWPPSLFVKNTLIPKLNSEEWLAWFELWIMFKFMDVLPEDLEDFGDIPEFQELFDLYNPYKIRESYVYTGDKTGEINGNVVFDLYFSSTSRLLHQDQARISIGKSSFLLPKEIKNTTITIKPTLIPGRIKPYTVTLDLTNEHVSIEPGETLVFSIELMPSDRVIGNLLTRLYERGFEERAKRTLGNFAEFFSKRRIEKLSDFGDTVQEFLNMSEMFAEEGVNLTLADFAGLVNSMLGSSFVFGSNAHASKVTVPLVLPTEEQENRITYYLYTDQTMDVLMPTGEEAGRKNLSEDPLLWTSQVFERNKILKSAEAVVYLDYRNLIPLRQITVRGALYDDGDEIISGDITLNRTRLIDLIQKKQSIITFSFSDLGYELWHDHRLQFGLSLANGTVLRFKKLYVLCDSSDTPSAVQATFEETTNLQMTYTAEPVSEKIVPSGSIDYLLNITSKYADTVTTQVSIDEKKGGWDITISPESIAIPAGGYQIIHIFVNSTDYLKAAYGNYIDLLMIVSGKTGKVQKTTSSTVSTNAIVYDVDLLIDETKLNIKKGEQQNFSFKIKNNNTGAIDDTDSYLITVTSEHELELAYDDIISDVRVGREKTVKVTVFIPKNTSVSSDLLQFTIISEENPATSIMANITIEITGDSILEMIYNLFASAAEALGLNDVFGSDFAPIALAIIFLVLIFFIIIIIALIVTTKIVKIICHDRVQEIDPAGDAQFVLTLHNPQKKQRTYEISAKEHPLSSKWETNLDVSSIQVNPGQEQSVTLTVKPVSQLKPDDWTEVIVTVQILGKRKQTELRVMVMIMNGKPSLRIKEVSHWPKKFSAGEKIVTSFKIENNSPIGARDVSVLLKVNGKEKNKVDGLVIPGRGYAEVSMPWLAVKGKNHVSIRLKEQ